MHDIDRTQLEEKQYEAPGYEVAHEVGGVYGEVPLHEAQEMELASELLEVANEEELEGFLRNVFKMVGSTLGRFARSDVGTALTGIVRNAARDALPTVGGAVGSWIAPGRGGALGSQLAQQAGALLGLELEGLSPPDQEFEAARQFVRFAGSAYANAAGAPRGAPFEAVARHAATAAAEQFAPGLAAATSPQGEEEFRGFRRGAGFRPRPRPGYRRYRPRPRYRGYGGYPVYAGWTWPVEAGAADAEPGWGGDEPAGQADGNGDEELAGPRAWSNGYAAGARNGRWVKRGRVLIVYGA
jgi:uncharacterized protein (DUF697 family)